MLSSFVNFSYNYLMIFNLELSAIIIGITYKAKMQRQQNNIILLLNLEWIEGQYLFLIRLLIIIVSQKPMFLDQNCSFSPTEMSIQADHLQSCSQQGEIHSSSNDKYIINNPNLGLSSFLQDSPCCDKEGSRKIVEGKMKYKKLKQRLNLEQGLIKDQRDITSPNKSRLMKLAIELEKAVKALATDYLQVEGFLKEIQKIVQHRREHDILILRGSRFMSSLLCLIKRYPTLHRTNALQSMPSMELSLKLLKIMLALSSSRQLLLICNQMIVISSLLSCALMRDQRHIAVHCLSILNLVIAGPSRIQLQELLNLNIQYILYSSILKRIKVSIQGYQTQDQPSNSQFLLLGFRFYYLVMNKSCQKELLRPIYETSFPDSLSSRAAVSYFEGAVQLLTCSINQIIYEKEHEGEERYMDEEIPNIKINFLLYIFKTLNVIFHTEVILAQKFIECNSQLLKAIRHVFDYAKQNFKQTVEIKSLCSQIIIFIGNLTFENHSYQDKIRTSGLLQALCNYPIDYIMEPLTNLFVPALFCVIHQNEINFKFAFQENSVHYFLQYIEKEISNRNQKKKDEEFNCQNGIMNGNLTNCHSHSRKTSVSSINSSYSKASMTTVAESSSQKSHNLGSGLQMSLQYKFRCEYWQQLRAELRKLDD